MTPPYQIAFWSFLCGAILGWIACDLRWRAAARKLNQVVKDLNRMVKSLPAPNAERAEKGPAETTPAGVGESVKRGNGKSGTTAADRLG